MVGVFNFSFLLRFFYYKFVVRNKCFIFDLILCRYKYFSLIFWLGSFDCFESSRDFINLSCYEEKGFICFLFVIYCFGNSFVYVENYEFLGSRRRG